MNRVFIRPLARKDIKKIWHYSYAIWGVKQADIYTKELGSAISSLIENPNIGRSINRIMQGYNLYQFKHHLIVYKIVPSGIDVVRILAENMNIRLHI